MFEMVLQSPSQLMDSSKPPSLPLTTNIIVPHIHRQQQQQFVQQNATTNVKGEKNEND